MVNRSAQVQTPAGLTDTESECRYQMSDCSLLKAGFKAFFDNVFQRPVFNAQVGKHQFETLVLVLKILDFFNIRSLHGTVSGLPVVVGGFRNAGLPADIFNSSSGTELNHSDDLMRALRIAISFVGGLIMPNDL